MKRESGSVSAKVKANREEEYCLRVALVKRHQCSRAYIDRNSDILKIPNFTACFTKTLKHDSKGQADREEVMKMLAGVRKCQCYLEKIEYPGTMRLINPSVVYSWDLIGPYKSSTDIPLPPKYESAELAHEMVELYAMALLRDVPFSEFGTSPLVAELNLSLGRVDLLFRGTTPGDLIGPYISQFLYLPYSNGLLEITQKYRTYLPGVDYMTKLDLALSAQNGTVKEGPVTKGVARYIITPRDGASFIHVDDTLQCGQAAALILNRLKCPGPKGSPFGKAPKPSQENGLCHADAVQERPFVDLGILDLYDVMTGATRVAMVSCWYHKWSIFQLRPEELGIIIERLYRHESLPQPHSDLLRSPILQKIQEKFGSRLLPQAYPEGSPPHPAYPSGHAVYAGVVTTILKAFYDEDFIFDGSVPNQDGSELVPLGQKLRVGDELDKLASNMALLRCVAGIHYRSDAAGIQLGEEIAISLLQDYVLRYTQKVTFSFHRRDRRLVTINNCQE